VYNYADFQLEMDSPHEDSDPRPFLLTVAQHQPNKRLDLLLQAFARLRREGRISQEFQLLVVGSEGSQSDRLRELGNTLELGAAAL
jgi:glycosyltransferase involved in cell wall biosynthesis